MLSLWNQQYFAALSNFLLRNPETSVRWFYWNSCWSRREPGWAKADGKHFTKTSTIGHVQSQNSAEEYFRFHWNCERIEVEARSSMSLCHYVRSYREFEWRPRVQLWRNLFFKKVADLNPANEDWVPLRKFFKSVSRIIGRPKSSRIGHLKVLTGLLGSWMLW